MNTESKSRALRISMRADVDIQIPLSAAVLNDLKVSLETTIQELLSYLAIRPYGGLLTSRRLPNGVVVLSTAEVYEPPIALNAEDSRRFADAILNPRDLTAGSPQAIEEEEGACKP